MRMTANTSIKLAFHIPTSKVIHIDNADNGKACKCECLKCKEKLIAVQGDIRDEHFRHNTNIICNGSQETALHLLGKQILLENNQITIPKWGTINYSDASIEKKFDSTRPDVTAIYNEQNIYFEIAVKHFIEKDKENFFTTGQHKCVEIDLSDADTTSYEKIKNLVLCQTSNKKIFGWKELLKHTDDNWFEKIVIFALIGTLIVSFSNWLSSKRRH